MNTIKKTILLLSLFMALYYKAQVPCNSSNSPTFQVSTSQVTLATNGVCGMQINIMNANTVPPGGAVSYSIIPPGAPTVSLPVVQPTPTVILVAGIYTVMVINNSNLCVTSQTVQVTILPAPNISIAVSNSLVCSGHITTLTASGANSYTWNTNVTTASLSVVPTTTTTYSVIGTGINGCANTAAFVLNVNPSPNVTVIASQNTVCVNEQVTLTANGANTYSWSTSQTEASIIVSPSVSAIYTVSGTNEFGCETSRQISITVSLCTNVEEFKIENEAFKIFPNPASDVLNVEKVIGFKILNDESLILNITNVMGQLVQEEELQFKNNSFAIKINNLENGVYFLNLRGNKTGFASKRFVIAR